MIVHCDLCAYSEDIGEEGPPHTCPECGCLDIWFEKDDDWNQVCGLWAMGNGWTGHPDSSLAEWYHREGRLSEWNSLKEKLADPTRIVPPESVRQAEGLSGRAMMIKFWLGEAGLIETWKRALKRMGDKMGMQLDQPPPAEEVLWGSYRTIRKLGKEYLSFWSLLGSSGRRNRNGR